MFGKKENLLGLDIGTHSVKLIQLDAKSTGLRLVNFGLAPLPDEAFDEGRVNRPGLIADTIKRLAAHLKIKGKSVAVSISGYEVMIKKIELPAMTELELDNRMHAELGQYIPYNIEEVDVDYQVMAPVKERPNQMEVLLVAAKKESVNDFVGLVKSSGMDPVVVDVDFYALSNAFETTYGFGKESVALLDIGSNKAIMSIIANGVPVFTRGISIGGNQINERIREQLGASPADAERIKLGELSDSVPSQELEDIFISVVQSWVGESRRAIDFYYSNYPDRKIDKLYISGGSCRLPGLDRVLQETLDVKVEIFNPLSRLEFDSQAFDGEYIDYIGPQMAIALGLALRKTKEI